MLSPEVQRLLRDDEPAVWVGRPDAAAWGLPQAVVLVVVMGALQVVVIPTWMFAGADAGAWMLVAAIALVAVTALLEVWWFSNLLYVLTPRRILIQKGFIGRDFEVVDLARVTDYSVRVGLWDKLLGRGTGSIRVRTASDSQATNPFGRILSGVKDVYAVQSTFLEAKDQAVLDVRDVAGTEGPTAAKPARRKRSPARKRA